MIRIFIDGELVHTLPGNAYTKRTLKVDIYDHRAAGTKAQEVDIPLPVLRGYDIKLDFGRRPQTDLEMLEENKRQEIMDREGLAALERKRLSEMAYDLNDPHHPDYVAPENETSNQTLARMIANVDEKDISELEDLVEQERTRQEEEIEENGTDNSMDSGSDSDNSVADSSVEGGGATGLETEEVTDSVEGGSDTVVPTETSVVPSNNPLSLG